MTDKEFLEHALGEILLYNTDEKWLSEKIDKFLEAEFRRKSLDEIAKEQEASGGQPESYMSIALRVAELEAQLHEVTAQRDGNLADCLAMEAQLAEARNDSQYGEYIQEEANNAMDWYIQAKARIAELEDERAGNNHWIMDLNEKVAKLEAQLAGELITENKRLRAALEEYADRSNWIVSGEYATPDYGWLGSDPMAIAEAVLRHDAKEVTE